MTRQFTIFYSRNKYQETEGFTVIHTFRKELRTWKIVLYPVLFGLGASSFFAISHYHDASSLGKVDGRAITYKEFEWKRSQINDRIAQARYYAQMLKLPVETFLHANELTNPGQSAFDACVRDSVIDSLVSDLTLVPHEEVVSAAIVKTLPADLISDTGEIRSQEYARILKANKNMYVADFENAIEASVARDFAEEAVELGLVLSPQIEKNEESMTAEVVTLSRDKVARTLSGTPTSDELRAYYSAHPELYRLAEKRVISAWRILPQVLAKKIEITDEKIARFYEKNKATLYRIAPRVKVKRLTIGLDTENGRQLIEEAHAKALENKESFDALIKEYSTEKSLDGVIDFFSRGTYESEFEKNAFKLKANGDISDIAETEKGYVISQLVERISASEKPLSEVRDEIVESLRGKKALDHLKDITKAIIKAASLDNEAGREFEAAAEKKKTFSFDAAKAPEDALAKALFNGAFVASLKEGGFATINHDGATYLLRIDELTPSIVQSYDDVKRAVANDYEAYRITHELDRVRWEVQTALLEGKSLSDIEKSFPVTTEELSLRLDSLPEKFVSARGQIEQLVDEKLVLALTNDDEAVFLVRRVGAQSNALTPVSGVYDGRYESEATEFKHAFIESLVRSATIVQRVSF